MNLAPVVLFTYNRADHLARTLDALKANLLASESDLYVFSDAASCEAHAGGVQEVRRLLRTVTGFRSVHVTEHAVNRGLAANVIAGVTDLVNRYGKVIVLEDDLITSPYFLTFMNEALEKYKDEERVMNVQGHVLHTRRELPETFFIRFINSWGWGTWKRAWDQFEPDGARLLSRLEERGLTREFDFDNRYPFTRMLRRQVEGLNHSWAIRWNATVFLNGGLSLNAGRSLVLNIGTDGSGTNFRTSAAYHTVLYNGPVSIDTERPLEEDSQARRQIGRVFAYEYSRITKGMRLLRALFLRLFHGMRR